MLISKAPVRISFAGGGTDLPAYYEKHGGVVLSATIDKYFYSILDYSNKNMFEIESSDYQLYQQLHKITDVKLDDPLMIPKAILRHFKVEDKLHLFLKSDIPPGSGLGLSGAVTTSLVQLISTFIKKPLSKKEIAKLASVIEIDVLKRPIGMQDQYASAFGGLNLITFNKDSIKVDPLKLKAENLDKLQKNLMLFFTGIHRNSATILSEQKKAIEDDNKQVINSLHKMKEIAFRMGDALLSGNILKFGKLLHESWEYKKAISKNISNPNIDKWYGLAIKQGAMGGKITGAGGGGFLLILCEKKHQDKIRDSLVREGLQELKFNFEQEGTSLVLDNVGHFESKITPEGYLLGMSAIVKRLDKTQIGRIADCIFAAYKNNKQVFIMGNGGSAATASHFCSDLSKTVQVNGRRGLKAIPLTDNVALMTAWGNDSGYEDIFYGQLYNLLNAGDVVIGISGGGISKNVLKAIKLAKERKAITIGLSGFKGGELKKLVDECLIVPCDNYQFIEDVHMVIVHLVTSLIRDRIAKE